MHANSPANSAPASSPARVAPAGSPAPERLTPRHRHQAATATVASAKRTKAWNTGATSATVALTSTCWKPQNMQQASSREMARASRWDLRVWGMGRCWCVSGTIDQGQTQVPPLLRVNCSLP